jgi:hypothetical protein
MMARIFPSFWVLWLALLPMGAHADSAPEAKVTRYLHNGSTQTYSIICAGENCHLSWYKNDELLESWSLPLEKGLKIISSFAYKVPIRVNTPTKEEPPTEAASLSWAVALNDRAGQGIIPAQTTDRMQVYGQRRAILDAVLELESRLHPF